MPRECIVSVHHAANAGIDLANAAVVVLVVDDVDVDWSAVVGDGMNVVDNFPVGAFRLAVWTFRGTSLVPAAQCSFPYLLEKTPLNHNIQSSYLNHLRHSLIDVNF